MRTTVKQRLPQAATVGLPLAAAALFAAGCAPGGGDYGAGASGTGPQSSVTVTQRGGADGTHLADGQGRSVYLFSADTAAASACSGVCLSEWQPLSTSGTVRAGSGVTRSLLSTITTGGDTQVEYNGHPLYYFSGDSGPGQVNGQGLDDFGGQWWLVSPAGAEVTSDTGGTSGSDYSGGSSW